ncbi:MULTISPECIES: GntR family transcriptional regulator [Saccharopolyspora]|uniref:GntR family transcriptional regulator n=1 Tax=Saccharopolyspora cebuensis TaxID=418759 RepID=A0ABV4CBL7_9PSEU
MTRASAGPIAERLREWIRRGVLRPGQHLVQEELAGELGVSRIPLREALHGLAAEGLIAVQPHRGMVVAELGRAELAELFELRLRLEPALAEEAVRGCRARDVEALRAAAERMREQGADAEGRAVENYRFHRRIYELAEQPLSLRFIDQLLHLVEPYSRRWVRSGHDLARIDAEHDAMVAALAAGDAGALRAAIVAHVEGARDHVLAAHG